jgi:endonuclease/exonuclease/phosphatase (EEP) superfamily protein YafD
MQRWLARIPELVLAACLVPLAVRLALRDRVPGLAALTYATPVCLLALTAAAACALAWLFGRRKLAGLSAAVAVALGAWTLAADVSVHGVTRPGHYRGLLWNVANGTRGWGGVTADVRQRDPDVAAFVEIGGASALTRGWALAAALPGREVHWWNSAVGIAVRGKIVDTEYHSLGRGSHAGVARVELDGRPLTVVVVHPRSTPTEPRGHVFEALEQVLEPLRGGPLLVMGDFNTPSDSVFFDPMRQSLRSAFETAGTGYAATWPMPLPVLVLDQVWASDSVDVRSCALAGSPASDHRMVTFSFDLPLSLARGARDPSPGGS